MNYRPQRVSSLIQEEIGRMLARNVEFAEGVLVTVTGVEVGDNLEHAKIWLGVIPSEAAAPALKVAQKARNEIQYLLMKKINIKPMPRIEFAIDRGPERAAEVEKALLEDDNE